MKRPVLLLSPLLLFCAATIALASDMGRPDLSDSEFAKRFSGSYGVLSAREPQITELEIAVLEKLAPLVEQSPERAQTALESLLADGKPLSAAFNHTLGNLYVTAKAWDRAEEQFREAIRKFPDFQRAWNSLGTMKMEQDDYGAAAEALARSIELGAGDAQTFGMLGYALLQQREYAAAEAAYNMALLRSPGNVLWLEGRARILSEAGRHVETLTTTDELLKKNPQNFEYWRLQANAQLALGRPTETARSLEIARNFGALDANALYLLGNIYLKEGMAEHALDSYLAAIKIQPDTAPSTLLRVASSLIGQSQFDLARRLLGTLAPGAAEWSARERTQLGLMQGQIAQHDGDAAAAIAAFERTIELDPTNAEALYRVGVLHADGDRPEKARYFLERISGNANFEYGAQLFLAKMLVGDGRFEEALTCLRNAYRIRPSAEIETLYNRVRVAAETQR